MEIKKINPDGSHTSDYIRLLNYCFGIKEEDIRFEMDYMFEESESVIYGAFESDQLKSSLIINDYNMFWNGKKVRMGGIGAVTSFPEVRQHHMVTKLLTHSLQKMRELKMTFSLLGPFSYSYYRKYGWEWGMNRMNYDISIMDFNHFREKDLTTRLVTTEDIEALKHVYTSTFNQLNGPLHRTTSHWKAQLSKNKEKNIHTYGVIDKTNTLVGYIFYELKDRTLKVIEMAYLSLEAKEHMCYFIYVHRAQVDRVKLSLAESDLFISMLTNQHQKITIDPGMMVRIVDVEAMLQSYPYNTTHDFKFSIQIDDDYAPWNNDIFLVTFSRNELTVSRSKDLEADIKCSIQTFSQISFGFRSFREAQRLNLLTYLDDQLISTLDYLMPKSPTYIQDAF